MPRRRRVSRRREDTGRLVLSLIVGDGFRDIAFPGDAEFSNQFLARAAWRTVRAACWQSPDRTFGRPPQAAVRWDAIGVDVLDYGPVGGPSHWENGERVSDWSPAEARRRLAADLASIEKFRAADPDAAAEIDAELASYATLLRLLVEATSATGPTYMSRAEAWREVEMRYA